MKHVLDDLDPGLAFTIWGYDLRGSEACEFAATIAEQGDTGGYEWDRPEWLEGWYRDGLPYTPPLHRALPWVSDVPPTRCMWRPESQWDAELTRGVMPNRPHR